MVNILYIIRSIMILISITFVLTLRVNGQVLPPTASEELSELSPLIESAQINQDPTVNLNKNTKLNMTNLINVWIRLSMTGRNQFEIENYLDQISPITIEETKSKLRQIVISSISNRIIDKNSFYNYDIMNNYKRIAQTITDYYGLDQDQEIKNQIENEFGLIL